MANTYGPIPKLVTKALTTYYVPKKVKELLRDFYGSFSPSNLDYWGLAETPACPLCLTRGSLEHIPSCCPNTLGEGRYRWRRDQVLKVVADAIAFIRAREKPQSQHKVPTGLLSSTLDWQLKVDLRRLMWFPQYIANMALMPDMFLTSDCTKQVVLLELTVSEEDHVVEAHEREKGKYLELVGCWGFPRHSLH